MYVTQFDKTSLIPFPNQLLVNKAAPLNILEVFPIAVKFQVGMRIYKLSNLDILKDYKTGLSDCVT